MFGRKYKQILKKELIAFYVKEFIDSTIMKRKSEFNTDRNGQVSVRFNWSLFIEYTRGISDGSAPFEFVNLSTPEGHRLYQHVER